MVGDRAVLGMLAREERLHQLLLRLEAQLLGELPERARLLELLDHELALPDVPVVRTAVLQVGLDRREHRLHKLCTRLLHIDELDRRVLGAVVAHARHLGVLSIAHLLVRRVGELGLARAQQLELRLQAVVGHALAARALGLVQHRRVALVVLDHQLGAGARLAEQALVQLGLRG